MESTVFRVHRTELRARSHLRRRAATRVRRSPSGKTTIERSIGASPSPHASRVNLKTVPSGNSCLAPSAEASVITPGPSETSLPLVVRPSSEKRGESSDPAAPGRPRRRRSQTMRPERPPRRARPEHRAWHPSEPSSIDCKRTTRISSSALALKDRQVIVGDLQDDQRHRRAILVAHTHVLPVARRATGG